MAKKVEKNKKHKIRIKRLNILVDTKMKRINLSYYRPQRHNVG